MGRELTDGEIERYSRQIVLRDIGYEGQTKLANAKVCIVGLGGLGSPLAVQLTAMGVGSLRLVDRDVVEWSNLHRQHLYGAGDVGYPKVEAAAKRLRAMNPDLELELLPLSLNVDNIGEILTGVDVVVDGLDRIETRYAVNRGVVRLKLPYVFAAAIEAFGNATTILPGETPCLECFYPNFTDDALPTCAVAGVHPAILNIVSSIQVSEAVRIIIGEKPKLAGQLFFCDLRDLSFEKIPLQRQQSCPVCGANPKNPPPALRRRLVEELCGREGKRCFIINPRQNMNLPMEELGKVVEARGLPIKVKAQYGLSLDYSAKISMNILKSGVMIVDGVGGEEETLKIYEDLLLTPLKIPRSSIE